VERFLTAAASLALVFAVSGAPLIASAQDAPASPAPSPSPAAAAPAVVTPVGVRPEAFVVGDYLNQPQVYNLASSGHSGLPSYDLRAAQEFKVEDMPFMIEFDTHDYTYTHFTDRSGTCPAFPGCVTLIGHTGQQYIPRTNERDTDLDGRVGYRIAKPRIYLVITYVGRESSFNFPGLNGVGFGLEKLPDYEKRFTFYASGFYVPSLQGKFTIYNRTTGATNIYQLTERDIRYQAGLMFAPLKSTPAFVDLGVIGDGVHGSDADPGSSTHFSGYAGIGLFAQ